jgi:8-oxo-dGTP diphosphatase
MKNIHNTLHVQTRAVLIKEEHILLCKTTGLDPDFYFLPGGHIEPGESAVNALRRELKEEVGFDFEIGRFLGCLEYSFDPGVMKHAKCHTHEYNFIFEASSSRLTSPHTPLKQVENHIEILWHPLPDLNRIDLRPELLKVLIPQWLKLDLAFAFKSKMI